MGRQERAGGAGLAGRGWGHLGRAARGGWRTLRVTKPLLEDVLDLEGHISVGSHHPKNINRNLDRLLLTLGTTKIHPRR